MSKWVINDDGDRDFIGGYDVWIEEPDPEDPDCGTIIAACFREHGPLLVHAPDMLEMLKELVEAWDDEVLGQKRKEQAEIVIAMAEGRL